VRNRSLCLHFTRNKEALSIFLIGRLEAYAPVALKSLRICERCRLFILIRENIHMVHHPDRANCFKSLNSLVFDHRDIVGDRLTGTRIVDIDYVGEASSLCFLSKRAKRDALLTWGAKRDDLLTSRL
jgi:hypothetical protein